MLSVRRWPSGAVVPAFGRVHEIAPLSVGGACYCFMIGPLNAALPQRGAPYEEGILNKEEFPGPDPARSRLRAAVAAVTDAFAAVPAVSSEASPEGQLRARWAALVDLLALGPEPPLRVCPSCGESGMRNATVCINCWAKLTPPDHEVVAPT